LIRPPTRRGPTPPIKLYILRYLIKPKNIDRTKNIPTVFDLPKIEIDLNSIQYDNIIWIRQQAVLCASPLLFKGIKSILFLKNGLKKKFAEKNYKNYLRGNNHEL
jgi:hypothetical protein